MILQRDAVVSDRPGRPGGGTVRFVSPGTHGYSRRLEAREEAGTPKLIGDVRAASAFPVMDTIGSAAMAAGNAALVEPALRAWPGHERIDRLGPDDRDRLPVLSFRFRGGRGGLLHHQRVTRLLSDRHVIRPRG